MQDNIFYINGVKIERNCLGGYRIYADNPNLVYLIIKYLNREGYYEFEEINKFSAPN